MRRPHFTCMTMAIVPLLVVLHIGLLGSPASAELPPKLSSSAENFPQSQDQDYANGVSCTARGLCIAVTYGGIIDALSGTRGAEVVATGASMTAVSCPTITFCAVVGGSSDALVLRPHASRVYLVTSAGFDSIVHWESLSCPTARFCMAGGGIIQGPHSGAGVVATWNGSHWSVAKVVDPFLASDTHTFIDSLSCASPTFCVGADGNNRTLQWNGVRWSFPRPLNAPTANDSFTVSCTSPTFCLALGQLPSDVLTWNGHAWTHRSAPKFTDDPYAFPEVSCASQVFCVAVADGGQASTWNGKQWAPAQIVDVGASFIAVSCWTGACEAVGGTNEANQFVYLHEAHRRPTLPMLCASFGCKVATT